MLLPPLNYLLCAFACWLLSPHWNAPPAPSSTQHQLLSQERPKTHACVDRQMRVWVPASARARVDTDHSRPLACLCSCLAPGSGSSSGAISTPPVLCFADEWDPLRHSLHQARPLGQEQPLHPACGPVRRVSRRYGWCAWSECPACRHTAIPPPDTVCDTQADSGPPVLGVPGGTCPCTEHRTLQGCGIRSASLQGDVRGATSVLVV